MAEPSALCAALGLDARRICTPEQVHGNRVLRVGRKDAGAAAVYSDSIAATDALITDEPGLPLLLCFADCTLILFAGPGPSGGRHCPWWRLEGTVQKIAAGTVQAMQAAFWHPSRGGAGWNRSGHRSLL